MATTAKKKKSTASKKKTFDKNTYVDWYKRMLLMRVFEEKSSALYIQQKFGGFCHLYIGQEALLAGMVSAMEEDDNVITAYRDHAHPLALGTDPKYVMAELFGKKTGLSKGKGGSMHMFDVSRRLFGGHGIVGAQIPLGAGIAFAEKYNGTKRATYCFMGDGAVRQGALHETFNMAMTWKLPVVFVIENNNYAMGTSVERTSNVHELYKLGCSYDMPGEEVDGMSCEAVHRAFANAAEHVRAGKGPILLEMKTYRYKGHSMSDPAKYRTKEELADYKEKDPIEQVLKTIKSKKYLTAKEIEQIKKEVKEQVDAAVQFAEESPFPDGQELYEDVYKTPDYPFVND